MNPWINAESLIEALRKKWLKEHPVYEDTSGSLTFSQIIDFIRDYVKTLNGEHYDC